MMDASSFAKTLVALVAIVNPIGAVPTFLAITEGLARNERRHMAWLAALTVGCVISTALPHDSPIRVLIGQQDRFAGTPGRVGQKLAVRLDGAITEGDVATAVPGTAHFDPTIVSDDLILTHPNTDQ